MAGEKMKYDYGKGEVPTTFEEFAAYVNRPVYEVKAAYERVNNLGLAAMGFRGEDLQQASLRDFAGLFLCGLLREKGYSIEESLACYTGCCRDVQTHLIGQFYLPRDAEHLILPRYVLWMFTLNFCRKDGPFYTEPEWERLMTFGRDDKGVLALNGEEIAEADALVRDRKLSPAQATELLIRIMEQQKT